MDRAYDGWRKRWAQELEALDDEDRRRIFDDAYAAGEQAGESRAWREATQEGRWM